MPSTKKQPRRKLGDNAAKSYSILGGKLPIQQHEVLSIASGCGDLFI